MSRAEVQGDGSGVAVALCGSALVVLVVLTDLNPLLGLVGAVVLVLVVALLLLGAETTGLILVGLAVFTAPLSALRPVPGASVVTLSDVLLCLGFPLLLGRMARTPLRLPLPLVLGYGLLLITALLGTLASETPAVALGYLLRIVAAVVLIPVAFCYLRPSLTVARLFAWAYVAGAILGWLIGLALKNAVAGREQGLTTHPNFLAFTGQLAFGLLLFLFLTGRRSRPVVVLAGVAVIWLIIVSGSRSGLLALVLLVVAVPVAQRSARALYALLCVGVLLVLGWNHLLASAGQGSAIHRLFLGDTTTPGSNLNREIALRTGWSDFVSHPLLGVGFTEQTLETHNIYLEMGQGAGVLGIVALLLILWSGIRVVLGRHTLSALGYIPLGYALVGFFQPTLWERLVWVPVGLAYVGAARYVSARSPAETLQTSGTAA